MLTWTDYKKHTESYWIDKEVITLKDMVNGFCEIPAGTRLKITEKYMGFTLSTIKVCKHCKIGHLVSISRVEPSTLRLCKEED